MNRRQDSDCRKCKKKLCTHDKCSRFIEQFYHTEPLVAMNETKGTEYYPVIDKKTGEIYYKHRGATVVPIDNNSFEYHQDEPIEPIRDWVFRNEQWIDVNWEKMN